MDYHCVFTKGLLRFQEEDFPLELTIKGEFHVETDNDNGIMTVSYPIEVKGQEPGRMIIQIAGQVNINDFRQLIASQMPPQA